MEDYYQEKRIKRLKNIELNMKLDELLDELLNAQPLPEKLFKIITQ